MDKERDRTWTRRHHRHVMKHGTSSIDIRFLVGGTVHCSRRPEPFSTMAKSGGSKGPQVAHVSCLSGTWTRRYAVGGRWYWMTCSDESPGVWVHWSSQSVQTGRDLRLPISGTFPSGCKAWVSSPPGTGELLMPHPSGQLYRAPSGSANQS